MRNLSILIVEDEPIISADLQDRLTEMGYQVLGPLASGEEALLFLRSADQLPDLILMDIMLEGELNGVETVRRIRERYELPVIFLTGNSDDKTFWEAREVHPAAFITKPFKGRDLRYAIELALTRPASAGAVYAQNSETFLLPDRMFVKSRDRMVRIFLEDILWIVADDYYCKIITSEREFLVTQTLKRLQEELAVQKSIVRVHRSYLVNLKHVTEIGDSCLFIGAHQIPYNKSAKGDLLSRLKKI